MTTPAPPDEPSETPIQQFRMPLEAWTAFGTMCHRRGMLRARHLFDLMWRDVKRHGTEDEKETFAAANRQLRARRARRHSP